MKKIILSSVLMLIGVSLKSQNDTKLTDNPRLIKAAEQKNAHIMNENSNKKVSVSEYYGLEEQILSFMTKKEIPSELPKAKGFESKAKYIEAINQWMKSKPSLIIVEKRDHLITE